MVIRRPAPNEHNSVRALVQTVVDEVYGGKWAPPPLPIAEEDWSLAWVAVSESKIVGMVLTHEEWISDLWVLREHRSRGIGQQLLLHGESEIAGRGYGTFFLRVVKSNAGAVAFYNRLGWKVAREFPHETLLIAMLEMNKASSAGGLTESSADRDRQR
jgi:ribosomal protein S18 acetylase RimI-like enzyme